MAVINLDTNVIPVAYHRDDNSVRKSHADPRNLSRQWLLHSPPVYGELRADPDWKSNLQPFLVALDIHIIWDMPATVWDNAGQLLRKYTDLRKGGKLPRRILADFLIAAHAEHHKFNVMSFDETVYTVVLENTKLIVP